MCKRQNSEEFKNTSVIIEMIKLVRVVDSDMPLSRLHCFIYILDSPGCSTSDIIRALSLTGASASRNLAALGYEGYPNQKTKKRIPGLRLIEKRTDQRDARIKRYFPTPIGVVLGELIAERWSVQR